MKIDTGLIAIILVTTIIITLFVVMRDDWFGHDAYYYLTIHCQSNHTNELKEPHTAFYKQNILQNLPCQIPHLKIIHGIIILITTTLIYYTTKKITKPPKKWNVPIALLPFTTPIYIGELLKFENEAWAYPLLFLSFLIIIHSTTTKKNQTTLSIIALIPLLIAFQIWKGTALFLIGLSFLNPLYTFITVFSIASNFNEFIGAIVPVQGILERTPMLGFVMLSTLLIFGIPGLIKKLKRKEHFFLFPAIAFFIILDFLTMNFVMFAIPILTIGTAFALQKQQKITPIITTVAIIIIVAITMYSIAGKEPTKQQWETIKETLLTEKNIQTDWEIGYWVWYAGGNTSSFGSPSNQKPFKKGTIILSKKVYCSQGKPIKIKKHGNLYAYYCH